MEHKIVMAGFGGQGIMVMGRLLAYAAMEEGKNVSWIPSYGVEQRGGTANCSVVVADEIIAAPIVSEPTYAIIMNRPSLDKFEPKMAEGGILIVNTSIVDRDVQRKDLDVLTLACNDIALDLGDVRYANMVALGAFCKKTGIIELKTLKESLRKVLSARRQNLVEINQKALEKGYELG